MSIPLLSHNPDWFRQADLLIDDLGHLLGARALRLDHVGSTAVPGLIAKPKLHIDVTLAPGFSPAALSNDLLLYGYHDLGARFREDEVQMTRPAGPAHRSKERENHELIIAHRLCLCAYDCPSPDQRRQFRDALRGDASLAGRLCRVETGPCPQGQFEPRLGNIQFRQDIFHRRRALGGRYATDPAMTLLPAPPSLPPLNGTLHPAARFAIHRLGAEKHRPKLQELETGRQYAL